MNKFYPLIKDKSKLIADYGNENSSELCSSISQVCVVCFCTLRALPLVFWCWFEWNGIKGWDMNKWLIVELSKKFLCTYDEIFLCVDRCHQFQMDNNILQPWRGFIRITDWIIFLLVVFNLDLITISVNSIFLAQYRNEKIDYEIWKFATHAIQSVASSIVM